MTLTSSYEILTIIEMCKTFQWCDTMLLSIPVCLCYIFHLNPQMLQFCFSLCISIRFWMVLKGFSSPIQ